MYTLCSGVNYTQGSLNLDDVTVDSAEELSAAIVKIIVGEPDAINFVFTVSVKEPD